MPHVTVGALGAGQDAAIRELVAAIRTGTSALVTGADNTGDVLARATPLLEAARLRVLTVRPPLDLDAFLEQVAPSLADSSELGIERAFVALTGPEPGSDGVALLVEDAHLMPQTTLRYIEWALRSSPRLRVAMAGQADILNVLALPSFGPLRDRLKLHLVVHAAPEPSRALVASPAIPIPRREGRRGLALFLGGCVGAICVGSAALYLRMAPPGWPSPGRPAPGAVAPAAAPRPAREAKPDTPPVPSASAATGLAAAPSLAGHAVAPVVEAPLTAAAAAPPATPAETALAAPPPAPIAVPAVQASAPAAAPLAAPLIPAAAAPPVVTRDPDMAVVPRGAFLMGSAEDPSERPLHVVVVPPLLIGRHAVTNREWAACVEAGPCPDVAHGDPDAPATNVSWNDARAYATWLSSVTGHSYRLPAEAEWEYAARGGTSTRYAWGDAMLPGRTSCKGCGSPTDIHRPPATGAFPPNAFGLYGMGGGAAEWVADCWHRDFQGAPVKAPLVWDAPGCAMRVLRGGSWMDDATDQRASSRQSYDGAVRYPTHGFRLIRSE